MLNSQIGKVVDKIATAMEPGRKTVGVHALPNRSIELPLSQGFAAILARFHLEPAKALGGGYSTEAEHSGEKTPDVAVSAPVERAESTNAIRPPDADDTIPGGRYAEHARETEKEAYSSHSYAKNDLVTQGGSAALLAAEDSEITPDREQDSSVTSKVPDQLADISFGPIATSLVSGQQDCPDVETFGKAPNVLGAAFHDIPVFSMPEGDSLSRQARLSDTMTEPGFPPRGTYGHDADRADGRMTAQDRVPSGPPILTYRHMQVPNQGNGEWPVPSDPLMGASDQSEMLGVSDQWDIARHARETAPKPLSAWLDSPLENASVTRPQYPLGSLPDIPEITPVAIDHGAGQTDLSQGGVETDKKVNVHIRDQPIMPNGVSFAEAAISQSMGVVVENRAFDMVPSALPNASTVDPARRSDDMPLRPEPPKPEVHNGPLRPVGPVAPVPEMGNAKVPARLVASDTVAAAERPTQFVATPPTRSSGRDTVTTIHASAVEADSPDHAPNPAIKTAIAPSQTMVAEHPYSHAIVPRPDAQVTPTASPLMSSVQQPQTSAPPPDPSVITFGQHSSSVEAFPGHSLERGELDLLQRPETVRYSTAQLLAEAGVLPRAGPPGQPPQADIPRHVAQQIVAAVRSGGEMASELHLSPSELGRVRISLSSSDLGMIVSIVADRPETLELMRRHADQLAQDFHDIGYHAAQFSFGQGASDHTQDERVQQGNQSQHDMGVTEDKTHASKVPNAAAGIDLDRLDLRI
ncbi:MAG: flagellar hook-length control protein FliK [Rhodobacteraceae bacterium]|nr:flagellar hook-length control protein FliK [Paracoccaceae bacterium]